MTLNRFKLYRHVGEFFNIFDAVKKKNVKFFKKYIIVYLMLQCFYARKNNSIFTKFNYNFLNFFNRKFKIYKRLLYFKLYFLEYILSILKKSVYVLNLKLSRKLNRNLDYFLKFVLFKLNYFLNLLNSFNFKNNFFLFKITLFFLKKEYQKYLIIKSTFIFFFLIKKLLFFYSKLVKYYKVIKNILFKKHKIFRFRKRLFYKGINLYIFNTVYELIPDDFLSVQKKKRFFQFLLRYPKKFKYTLKYLLFILSSKKRFRMKESRYSKKLLFKKSLVLNFNLNSKDIYNLLKNKNVLRPLVISNYLDFLNRKLDVYLYQLNWIPSLDFISKNVPFSYFFVNFIKVNLSISFLNVGDIISFNSYFLKYILYRRKKNIIQSVGTILKIYNIYLNKYFKDIKIHLQKKSYRYIKRFYYKNYNRKRRNRYFTIQKINKIRTKNPSLFYGKFSSLFDKLDFKHRFTYYKFIHRFSLRKFLGIKNYFYTDYFYNNIFKSLNSIYKNNYNNSKLRCSKIYLNKKFKINQVLKLKFFLKKSKLFIKSQKLLNFIKKYLILYIKLNKKVLKINFKKIRNKSSKKLFNFLVSFWNNSYRMDRLLLKKKLYLLKKKFNDRSFLGNRFFLFNYFNSLVSKFRNKKSKYKYNIKNKLKFVLRRNYVENRLFTKKIKKKVYNSMQRFLFFFKYNLYKNLFYKKKYNLYFFSSKYSNSIYLFNKFLFSNENLFNYKKLFTLLNVSKFKFLNKNLNLNLLFNKSINYLLKVYFKKNLKFTNNNLNIISNNLNFINSNLLYVSDLFNQVISSIIIKFPWLSGIHLFFNLKKKITSFFNFVFYNYNYNYIIFLKKSKDILDINLITSIFYYNFLNYSFNLNFLYRISNFYKYKFSYLNSGIHLSYLING